MIDGTNLSGDGDEARAPRIVGIGGSNRPGSVSAAALRLAMRFAGELGAHGTVFEVPRLDLPAYPVERHERTHDAIRLVTAARQADGFIVSVPCYHGTIGGEVKTALDYLEDLASDEERPYLTDTAMGIISVAHGWNAAVATITTVRTIAHALRAWPTPLGVPLTTRMDPVFEADGHCSDERTLTRLATLAREVVEFSAMRLAHRPATEARS